VATPIRATIRNTSGLIGDDDGDNDGDGGAGYDKDDTTRAVEIDRDLSRKRIGPLALARLYGEF
jgi:hypothetical protein